MGEDDDAPPEEKSAGCSEPSLQQRRAARPLSFTLIEPADGVPETKMLDEDLSEDLVTREDCEAMFALATKVAAEPVAIAPPPHYRIRGQSRTNQLGLSTSPPQPSAFLRAGKGAKGAKASSVAQKRRLPAGKRWIVKKP